MSLSGTDLFSQAGFDGFCNAMPGVTFVDQWDSHVAKVGGKVFAVLGQKDNWRLVLRCSEHSFEILTDLHGIGQAPYFAKRRWVSINEDAPLSAEELEHYLRRSYELVAAGLTKKLRAELGIILPDTPAF